MTTTTPVVEELELFAAFCGDLRIESGARMVLEPFQRTILTDFFAGTTETLCVLPKKSGKALALETAIATPDGWTEMGDLRVGDEVFGPDGSPTAVVAVTGPMFDRPCFRMELGDGQQFTADAEHEWLTDARNRGVGVRTTAEIAATLADLFVAGAKRHRIDVAEALELPEADLLVDPYTLGVWLGDGSTVSGRITNPDSEVWEALPYEFGRPTVKSGCVTCTPLGLQGQLRELGVLGNKHIPGEYLRSSRRQRLALLRGLMDTDGTISKRGCCEFDTTSPSLAAGTLELIRSLGWKVTAMDRRAVLGGVDHGPAWRLSFTAYADQPVFTILRKVARQNPPPVSRTRSQVRTVVACAPVNSVPVCCIQVARADGCSLLASRWSQRTTQLCLARSRCSRCAPRRMRRS